MLPSALKKEIFVILSVYNGERYLSQSLESLIKQDLAKDMYSVLIIDDGSSDRTPFILNSYKGIENFIVIKNKTKRSLSFSLNKALALIKSKYVIRFDADDIALTGLLSELFNNIHESAFCHPFMYIFKDDKFEKKFLYKVSSLPSFFASGVLFRYDVLSQYKFSDMFWEEFDLYLEILEDGYKYRIVPKPLLYHRLHTENITSNKKEFVAGYYQLQKKWGKRILNKYNLNLENLYKYYGYYFRGGNRL